MIVSTKLTKHSHYPAGIPAGFFYVLHNRDYLLAGKVIPRHVKSIAASK